MKLFLLIFLLPFTSTPIGYRQLKWNDFKGVPPANTEASACTCTNIAIGYDTAYAIFLPERSWTKTSDPAVLRHEQLHFAITTYWARAIIILQRKGFHKIDWCVEQWRDNEQRYDIETNHGQDSIAQVKWEQWAEYNSVGLEVGKNK